MKKNMGATDKRLRVLIAITIVLLYYFELIQGTLAYILLAFAIVFVLTSLISFCPLYRPLGINTCKKN